MGAAILGITRKSELQCAGMNYIPSGGTQANPKITLHGHGSPCSCALCAPAAQPNGSVTRFGAEVWLTFLSLFQLCSLPCQS